MVLSIVGLGPGESQFLTVGALDAMRAATRTVVVGAPADLRAYLRANGVELDDTTVSDPAALASGTASAVAAFAERAGASEGTTALAVLGHPLSDFAGLPEMV